MKSKNNIIFLIVSVFLLSCVLFIVHTIPENEVLGTVYFFNGKTERYVTVDFNHIKQLNDCTDVTDTIAIERIIADEIITGLSQENRDGSFDVIFQAVVKNHLTTQRCFNTFVINELRFLA